MDGFVLLFILFIIFLFIVFARLQLNQSTKQELEKQVASLLSENESLKTELDSLRCTFNEDVERTIAEKVSSIRFQPQYESIPIFQKFLEIPLHNGRFLRSVNEKMAIRNFMASAIITGESGNTYHTTLTKCSCMDFKIKGSPCKHMYRLATELGMLIGTAIEDGYSIKYLCAREAQVTKEEEALKKEKSELKKIVAAKKQSCPYLVNLFSDYYYLQDLKLADRLEFKSPPAVKAAESVRILSNEKKELLQKLKLAEYQLNFYESLFPWLLDFKEVSPQEVTTVLSDQLESKNTETNEYLHFKKYLSPIEFNNLSRIEKLQLSLNRYQARNKTNWEIGIEYERYIGYLYETKGYTVNYYGALEGLKDMGRDLLIKSKNSVEIIQCKRWAQEKVIHEKHIFQLYGSVVLYQIQHPNSKVSGVFYATTSLSETAKECADYLGIKYYENFPYQEYPLIKCNISKTGEKIYHLPFDQQYDKTFITPQNGDTYTATIKEAEDLGFRHAYKWNPENVNL